MSKRLLVLGLLGAVFVFVLQLRPIDDVDLFWQIRLGQLMIERGDLVRTDPFTYTHPGDPQPATGWLAQLVAAILHAGGSWWFLRLVHCLFFASAFVLAASTVREGSLTCAVAAAGLGFLVALSNSSVRPQSIALLGFVVLLQITRCSWPLGWKLALLVPVLLVWQNCHPSAILGLIAVGTLVAADTLRRLWNRAETFPWQPLAIALVVALSQFATPLGMDVFRISRINLQISRDWLGVSEWLPPWDERVRGAMLVFWIALALAVVLLLRIGRKARWDEVCLFLVMTGLSLTAARLTLFWAAAMVPIFGRWFEAARPAEFFHWPDGETSRAKAGTLLTGATLTAVILPTVLPLPILSSELPLDGVRALRAGLPTGRVYNYREWGGPLVLEGSPDWRIALDGRLYLFPEEREWREYNDAALGRIPVAELVARHRPDAFFLRPTFHANLIHLLRAEAGWREVYADETCVAFVRSHDRGWQVPDP
jgi:hypothetical protein